MERLSRTTPFDGSTPTLSFPIQHDAPRPSAPVVIRRGFAVALLSVSKDFYRYWTTANEQTIVNNNPFADPLRVHSTLDGGLGVSPLAYWKPSSE